MTRRSGQNPMLRIGTRADGTKYYFLQYWTDVPGQAERKRQTEVIGLVSEMKHKEAERKRRQFILQLGINSDEYLIPSSLRFADAVTHYREVFAPRMLRASTFSIAKTHIEKHLAPDWDDIPIEQITIDSVNEWVWKKRAEGLSWVTIKNILRTMQRILSCNSKSRKPPFNQEGLAIPQSDKLQMQLAGREAVSFSWKQSQQIAKKVRSLEDLDDHRKERYATLFTLASASGLRCGELFALRMNDLNFKASTIRVEESFDRLGKVGRCKNAAAYRTVLLTDREGKQAMRLLKSFVADRFQNSIAFVFASRRQTPLQESQVLREGLHPALEALGFPRAGMHAFRRGCNRRWELAGINPAVLRQQMGHTSSAMTALYTGRIPLEQVRAAFSNKMENMENEEAA